MKDEKRSMGSWRPTDDLHPSSFILHPYSRRGFSLVELLVAIGILIVLASIFIPYALSKLEASRRIQCQRNLGQIYVALSNYAHDNKGAFPRVIYDAAGNPNGYVAFTGPDGDSPFAPGSYVKPNDVTASLWLLVRGGYASPNIFVCPSASDVQDKLTNANGVSVPAAMRANFRNAYNLSYSYATPFSSAPEYRLNDDQRWEFALLADRNPGVVAPPANSPPTELAKGNSRNHRGAGQCVLHPGGSVLFERTPYCGVYGDNIYTVQAPKVLGPDEHVPPNGVGLISQDAGPAWNFDSYLVPME